VGSPDRPELAGLSVLAAALERAGYTVRWAASLQEAQRATTRQEPRLAVVDMGLEAGDAANACRALLLYSAARVVLVYGDEEQHRRALELVRAGASDCLPANEDPDLTLARVTAAMR
jgi:DNA-binding response OmpR family regulator